ncbi:thioredoxin-like protein [Plectosphaerella plurivora]|uniref:Thioredoxin-like protein n=1 Tax=Plectosphaerella plurivora TaxID=936078 RepID=A0A9P9A4X6_9PEZI|nr:thioredoxin-like protein [Plectosphaerella plurivora]
MGGTIKAYTAFTELTQLQPALEAHGVTIDLVPVLIGAINVGSGNKPPWTLPAKARYLPNDSRRSAVRLGLTNIRTPDDLMSVGMTVLPLRALHHIKATRPESTYLAVWAHLFSLFWCPPNANLTRADVLAEALGEVPNQTGGKLFTPDDVASILAAATTPEMKDALKKATQEALDRGAYGAPWLWVTNSTGQSEPFFGSDRFGHVFRFLDLPFQDVTLLPPKDAKL